MGDVGFSRPNYPGHSDKRLIKGEGETIDFPRLLSPYSFKCPIFFPPFTNPDSINQQALKALQTICKLDEGIKAR